MMRTILGTFASIGWIVAMFSLLAILVAICFAFEMVIWLLKLAKLRNLSQTVADYYDRLLPDECNEYEVLYRDDYGRMAASYEAWRRDNDRLIAMAFNPVQTAQSLQPVEKVNWKAEGF